MGTAVRYDSIVIGAGHNGLVCAAMLARAGRSVVVLESAAAVGGAACTQEFAPGYRVSAGAHLLHMMPRSILTELALENHGLKFAARAMRTTILTPGAAPNFLGHGLSTQDQEQLGAYNARMQRFAQALMPLFSRVPPRLGTDAWADRVALLKLALSVRRLGRRDMRELLRIGGMNVHDLLEENFESEALKGALALDAVLGANFGPRSPGTVLTLLHRLAGECAAGMPGQTLAQPLGGMGAVSAALAKSAESAGVAIRTHSEVRRILVEDDRAVGIELTNGERIGTRSVISNADPKTTFLRLLGAAHLDTGFVRRVHHLRGQGLAAKLHIALKRPPLFAGASEAQLRGRLVLAPSLQYLEHAYNHSKYGEYSANPALEITVPSANDAALAPEGHHVVSVVAQYAPYALRGGWSATARQGFTDAVLDQLEAVAPGLRESMAAVQLLTPLDLEARFGMHGGHWHHGDLAFDQFLMVRPVPGAAQHRTPLAGLYLCGAGCHPGGGVMGVAGRNAATQVLTGAAS